MGMRGRRVGVACVSHPNGNADRTTRTIAPTLIGPSPHLVQGVDEFDVLLRNLRPRPCCSCSAAAALLGKRGHGGGAAV